MKSGKNRHFTPYPFLLAALPLFAQTAYLRTTTNANPWVDGGTVTAAPWATATNYIEVFPNTKYQTIQGFGGCFCEMGWDAVSALSAAGRDSVFRALFDTSGCNFTICRLPIGANDFADGYYSLNDVSGDYQMNSFSLKRDSTKLIPFIKVAQAIKPNMRFWASPWTPPSWMKTNNNYTTGSMKSDAQTLTAYALYLAKAVKAFNAIGINIEYITCQNEPTQCTQNYPTCCWTNSLQLNFYKNYMIPRFRQDNITAKIILGVYCCESYADWITYFMNDATVRSWVGATSHSWADYDWGRQAWIDYPDIPFIQTEADWNRNGAHDWNAGVKQFNDLVEFLIVAKAAVFEQWNMILDTTYSSHWGFAQSCPIHINTVAKKVYYMPHFYAVKHFAHYVMVGAKGINIVTNGTNPGHKAAFLNPNGDMIVCISNTGNSAYSATIKVNSEMYKVTMPANSFNTVRIASTTAALPAIVPKNNGMPALNARNARISNSMLYFTLPTAANAREMNITLTDLQGHTVWTEHCRGGAVFNERQAFTIRPTQGGLRSGTYLLTVTIIDKTGAVTTVENKLAAMN